MPFQARRNAEVYHEVSTDPTRKNLQTHRHVNRDQTKPDESQGIRPFGALWSITQREQETGDKKPKVEVIQDQVQVMQLRDIVLQCSSEDDKSNVVVALTGVRRQPDYLS